MGTKEQKKGEEGYEICEPHTLQGSLCLHPNSCQWHTPCCLRLPGRELEKPWGIPAPVAGKARQHSCLECQDMRSEQERDSNFFWFNPVCLLGGSSDSAMCPRPHHSRGSCQTSHPYVMKHTTPPSPRDSVGPLIFQIPRRAA